MKSKKHPAFWSGLKNNFIFYIPGARYGGRFLSLSRNRTGVYSYNKMEQKWQTLVLYQFFKIDVKKKPSDDMYHKEEILQEKSSSSVISINVHRIYWNSWDPLSIRLSDHSDSLSHPIIMKSWFMVLLEFPYNKECASLRNTFIL